MELNIQIKFKNLLIISILELLFFCNNSFAKHKSKDIYSEIAGKVYNKINRQNFKGNLKLMIGKFYLHDTTETITGNEIASRVGDKLSGKITEENQKTDKNVKSIEIIKSDNDYQIIIDNLSKKQLDSFQRNNPFKIRKKIIPNYILVGKYDLDSNKKLIITSINLYCLNPAANLSWGDLELISTNENLHFKLNDEDFQIFKNRNNNKNIPLLLSKIDNNTTAGLNSNNSSLTITNELNESVDAINTNQTIKVNVQLPSGSTYSYLYLLEFERFNDNLIHAYSLYSTDISAVNSIFRFPKIFQFSENPPDIITLVLIASKTPLDNLNSSENNIKIGVNKELNDALFKDIYFRIKQQPESIFIISKNISVANN